MLTSKQFSAFTTLAYCALRCCLSTLRRPHFALLLTAPVLAILAACSSGGSDDDGQPIAQESLVPFQFKSIEISPPAGTAAVGTKLQFIVMGIKEDSSKENLTTRVSWSSSNEASAEIDASGVATAIAPGTAIISATYSSDGRSLTRSAGVTVSDAGLESISITPAEPTIAAGTRVALTATGNYSDGSTQNISGSVSWQSADEGIVSTTNANSNAVQATGISAGTTAVTATLNDISDTVTVTVTDANLESIAVTPSVATIATGTQQQFIAMGSFTDGSTQELNANVDWASSNTTVATVGNDAAEGGLAKAAEAGTTTISATQDGIRGEASLTVTTAELVSIAVTPAAPSIATGTQQQFTATGTYADDTTQDLTDNAVWSSSNEDVASIANADGQQGLASSNQQGTTTITATLSGISGSTELTVGAQSLVSIEVTPTNPTITAGTTQQFTATGSYSDSSTQDLTDAVSWQSSNTAVATINSTGDNKGLATTGTAGSAEISASIDGVSGNTTLTVNAPDLRSLEISPDNPSITLGGERQLTATGTFSDGSTQDLTAAVTWGPSSSEIATISNATGSEGLATALGLGTITVTATSGSVSDTTELTVIDRELVSLTIEPADVNLPIGGEQQYSATGNYNFGDPEDLTDAVDWSSTDTGVATIDNAAERKGLAAAAGEGNTDIEARMDGVVGSTGLTVTTAILQSLRVEPSAVTVANGDTQQFTATGSYSDGDRDITAEVSWESSSTNVASVSNATGSHGLATSTALGETNIIATSGEIQGSATLTVAAPRLTGIAVTPQNASINVDGEQQYTATGTYSDSSTENLTDSVTWSSANENIASISDDPAASRGLARGNSAGNVTITATFEDFEGEANLEVKEPEVVEPTLERIEITPQDESIDVDDTLQYTATAFYSDDSSADRTSSATWSSSNDDIASISDDPAASRGLARGNSGGSVTIVATFEGFEAESSLEVKPEVIERELTGITITPRDASINVGDDQQYTATGSYSDGSTANIPGASVTWSSSNPDIAQFNNAEGLVSANTAGSVTIRATFEGFDDETNLEVKEPEVVEPELTGITITPREASINIGDDQQYTATGSYSDDSTANIPGASVTWSSSNPDIAQFNNAEGLVSANTAGTVTIRATFEDFEDKTTLEVKERNPDLVVTLLETVGSAVVNQEGNVELPIRVVVRNQGNTEAAVFKISTEYTNPQGSTFVVAFTVDGQNSTFYPFTSDSLAAGAEVSFSGTVTFHSSVRELTVSLRAIADSCSGEEFTEAYCRVDESDEGNNRSSALSVTLP